MEVTVTKEYLAILFILWIGPVVSAVWGYPIWATISFMCMFAIYAGHEWIHVWICKINNLKVMNVDLATRGKSASFFEEAEGPNKDKIEADVFLGGVVWDSILFAITVLSCIFYAFYYGDILPFICGAGFGLILILNLAMPGSDWQEYMKRTTTRV